MACRAHGLAGVYVLSSGDFLSHFLQQMNLTSSVKAKPATEQPWLLSQPSQCTTQFFYLSSGEATLRQSGQEQHSKKQSAKEQKVQPNVIYLLAQGQAFELLGKQLAEPLVYGEFAFPHLQHWGSDSKFGHAPDLLALPANPRMQTLLSWISQELSDSHAGGSYMNQVMMLQLLTESMRLLLASDHTPSWLLGAKNNRLAPALLSIARQYQLDWRVERLASLCAMSRSTFVELFKQQLHQTPADYLRQWRCFMAAQKLAKSTRPISEIATQVGYGSSDVLIRNFKQVHNQTPLQYRKAFQQTW